MTELQKILIAFEGIELDKERAALATLVKIEGSSYRRPGARMMISESGEWTGAISGGCLEGDMLLRAKRIIEKGLPTVVRYDTKNDDANVFGVGMGCEGIIDVLIEPVTSANSECLTSLSSITSPQLNTVHALVFRSENPKINVGTRWLIEGDSRKSDNLLIDELWNDCLRQRELGKSSSCIYTTPAGEVEVFIEVVKPQTRLVIIGAGNDAMPVASLASTLGWHITVADKSPAKATTSRFPSADKVRCLSADRISNEITINAHTVCVLMLHNYHYELTVLQQLLGTDAGYIGLLGPRKRWDKMQRELQESGVEISDRDRDRIFSPVGLNIGAESSEEIAVSIIAEIQSVLANADGCSLRMKEGTIHERE